jgi:hypothetical protein
MSIDDTSAAAATTGLAPVDDLRHLLHLMGEHGLFEHALGNEPRREHGYCTDDNARLLIVAARSRPSAAASSLARAAVAFVLDAQSPDGRIRNRMDDAGHWTDDATTDDCWGRAVWACGVAAVHSPDEDVRHDAVRMLSTSMTLSSPSPRSMAFAALGAAEVMSVDRSNLVARRLLMRTLATIGPIPSGDWCWPQARLGYANAALAEAIIAAGAAVSSPADLDRGLRMLGWLLEREMRAGHLSVTAAGGSGPGDSGPRFDQQPIEVAAMADACARALSVTGDRAWGRGIEAAAAWFDGHNDAGLVMFDPLTGGGLDGLHADAVNRNQGAESTLALISTRQRAAEFALSS